MVTALGLYCDLLDEPGVLAVAFAHYSNELRLVAAASRRLVEKLVALDANADARADLRADARAAGEPDRNRPGNDPAGCVDELDEPASGSWTAGGLPEPALRRALDRSLDWTMNNGAGLAAATRSSDAGAGRSRRWESIFAEPINNLAGELAANRNLLAALAGSGIAVTVDTEGADRHVHLTAEDLTRLLVNMVKNAAEAMPFGGRIRITLSERPAPGGSPSKLVLAIEDTGPGIPAELTERIFVSGFTTHADGGAANAGWPSAHRGLGLAITRSIVEAAGGRIVAVNPVNPAGRAGARFEIELPVRSL
jgi:hypothetical protein